MTFWVGVAVGLTLCPFLLVTMVGVWAFCWRPWKKG